MKCVYSKHFTKYDFNPDKNELEKHTQVIQTQLTYKNCKAYRKYFWFMFKMMLGFLLFLWSVVLAAGFSTNFQGAGYVVGFSCCIPFSLVVITVCMTIGCCGYDLELEKEEIEQAYKDNVKYIELQKHNADEFSKMYQWRRKHPFEEKVRKALESKNGNDVAEVIKLILEMETI